MRSDRAFESGMPNYFRDVLSPIINSMSINEIEIYVPHNKMILSYIKNIDTRRIADGDFSSCEIKNNVIVICGDKSFINERYYYHFNKKRKSEEIFVFLDEESMRDISQSTGDILIIDDLCDGGKTFIEEAKYLKKLFPDKKLYLQVTHAIFSKGINVVADHFERIFCTNSYQDITHPKVTQIKVI
jgi:ribose-phosphate pyrophosphokinase